MAERKSGPVKPPTIDLTARNKPDESRATEEKKTAGRPAGARTPEAARTQHRAAADKSGATASGTGKAKPEKASSPRPAPWSRVVAAGIAGTVLGGALGLAGAYGLAMFGYWPGNGSAADIAALRDDLGTLYVRKSDIGGIVDRAVGEVDSALSDLEARIVMLENTAPADLPPELTSIDTRISGLESGLADLGGKLDAAILGGGDPEAARTLTRLGERMDMLSASLLELESRQVVAPESVSTLETALQTLHAEVSTLAGGVSELQSAPAPEPVDLRLPLALSGLGEALETGVPFRSELDLIRAALPDLIVPDQVVIAANSGLGSPADLEARFLARVPDMLAAKPVDGSQNWTDQALDRLKALVALRPVATDDDTTPEGLVSQIEAALAARDHTVAAAAFAALPAPMRAAADGIDRTVGRFAATAEFVTRARSAALDLADARS